MPLFPSLYNQDDRDRAIFGEHYTPEGETFEHGVPMKVAEFPASSEDGQRCVIFETRCPARFFELYVDGSPERKFQYFTVQARPAVIISTGSGDEVGKLLVQVAKAIANGMMGVKLPEGKA
jgi:hypothetical protein